LSTYHSPNFTFSKSTDIVNMKFLATLSVLSVTGFAAATPAGIDLSERQLGGRTATDLEDGDAANCPTAIMIFARGSTEGGNLGGTVGPALQGGLEGQIPDLWVQGVGGPYGATLAGNAARRGSPEDSIAEGVRLMQLANEKCPNSAVVAAGYSQGAALIAAAISDLDATVQEQVVGAALFGYTKNLQNGGEIPDYPADQTLVECATGDLVCTGSLVITPAHLSYNDEARGQAADFLAARVPAA
jgi:cutinase